MSSQRRVLNQGLYTIKYVTAIYQSPICKITGIDQPTGPTHSRKGRAISARFLPWENVEHSLCNRHQHKKNYSGTDEIQNILQYGEREVI